MEVIFNGMEVTSTMQCVNTLKQQNTRSPKQGTQQPHPEYKEKNPHKVIITSATGSDGTNIMEVKSKISGRTYSIHLEFTGEPTGMGEEIRETLKEKYIRQQWGSGSLQTAQDALQSPSQEGEREVQDT
ncbi:MAG: hypothetical protein NC121_12830 [Blautia sp.]|nr:hypothetical protein [Blautia sp.]